MDRIDVGNSNEIDKEIIHTMERVVQHVITFLNEMVQNNRQNRKKLRTSSKPECVGKEP